MKAHGQGAVDDLSGISSMPGLKSWPGCCILRGCTTKAFETLFYTAMVDT
jgi:hypothetical protein